VGEELRVNLPLGNSSAPAFPRAALFAQNMGCIDAGSGFQAWSAAFPGRRGGPCGTRPRAARMRCNARAQSQKRYSIPAIAGIMPCLHGSHHVEGEEVHRTRASSLELPDRRHCELLPIGFYSSVVVLDGLKVGRARRGRRFDTTQQTW